MATATIEEYLEAIYTMASEGQPPIGARLAERLSVSPPTVTDTLQRMQKQGLITLTVRKEICLTERGREVAETLTRRHRLSERWLTDVLGLNWARVHEEACKLEHAISAEVEERLSESLGRPTTCPHGNPIPGTPGEAPPADLLTLDRVAAGGRVVVERISEAAESDARLLQYLERQGVRPGAELFVEEVVPPDGPIVMRAGEHTAALGKEAATKIWVRPAETPAVS